MTHSRPEARLQVLLALRVATSGLRAADLSRLLDLSADAVDAHLERLEADGHIRRRGHSGDGAVLWVGEPPETVDDFRAAAAARKRLAQVARRSPAAPQRRRRAARETSPARLVSPRSQPECVARRDPLVAALFGASGTTR